MLNYLLDGSFSSKAALQGDPANRSILRRRGAYFNFYCVLNCVINGGGCLGELFLWSIFLVVFFLVRNFSKLFFFPSREKILLTTKIHSSEWS